MSYEIVFTNELYHFGTKGQRWGVRKWQNEDGTFNEAGKERYFGSSKERKAALKRYGVSGIDKKGSKGALTKENLEKEKKTLYERIDKNAKKYGDESTKEGKSNIQKTKNEVDKYLKEKYGNMTYDNFKKQQRDKIIKGAAIAAGVLAAAGATYAFAKSEKGKQMMSDAKAAKSFIADKAKYKNASESSIWNFKLSDGKVYNYSNAVNSLRRQGMSNSDINKELIKAYSKGDVMSFIIPKRR